LSPIIEVENISRSFRSTKKTQGSWGTWKLLWKPEFQVREALKDVSFTLEEGTFNGLIGANGAGKTTLLKILTGLIPPSSGKARVLGLEPFQRSFKFRHSISLVMGQKAQLWWDLPAIDAFDLLRAIYEIPSRIYQERLQTLANLLDVSKHLNTQIRRLSLGERMKMELIGAILHWPKVIFLDEPTIGLDVLAASKLRDFLKVFNAQEKATIILTSHNMDDIEKLCSRVLIMQSGKLIYDGRPAKLTHEGERRLKVRFFEAPSLQELQETTGIAQDLIECEHNQDDRSFHFSLKQERIVSVLQSLLNKYHVIDMGIEEQSLEKVIQRIYENELSGTQESHFKT
jgi:ABC-2 type transport system ATP-binding protein